MYVYKSYNGPSEGVSFGMKVSDYHGKCCCGVFDGACLDFGVASLPISLIITL